MEDKTDDRTDSRTPRGRRKDSRSSLNFSEALKLAGIKFTEEEREEEREETFDKVMNCLFNELYSEQDSSKVNMLDKKLSIMRKHAPKQTKWTSPVLQPIMLFIDYLLELKKKKEKKKKVKIKEIKIR